MKSNKIRKFAEVFSFRRINPVYGFVLTLHVEYLLD